MSKGTFPQKFQKIDDLTRSNHGLIKAHDTCPFFCEYAAGEGYQHSYVNQQIFNFKKSINDQNRPGLQSARQTSFSK